jgi:hypothetical protein
MLFRETVALYHVDHMEHTGTLRGQNAVPRRKHYVSVTKSNRLMLFGETVAVYCVHHKEHTDTLCGQKTEF